MLELAAPQIPAELFSFCIAAIPGPFIVVAAFGCTPAFALTLFHIDPKASPPEPADVAGFAAGLPSVAMVVLLVAKDGCDEDVVVDGVRAENADAGLVGVALISALTDVK